MHIMKLLEAGWPNLVEAPLTATSVSTTATLFCPPDSPYIDSYLNLSTTERPLKHVPNSQNNLSIMRGHRGFLLEVPSHAGMFYPRAANPT